MKRFISGFDFVDGHAKVEIRPFRNGEDLIPYVSFAKYMAVHLIEILVKKLIPEEINSYREWAIIHVIEGKTIHLFGEKYDKSEPEMRRNSSPTTGD